MREMVAKYPDDLDAATMFAESLMMLRPWQLWSLEGEPAPGTLELVAVLESVLRRNPDHPGANHFYIHAVEASRNLERAIPSAMRLMTLTPGAGHLVHMPGHIFLQTGDFDLAAETNVKASAADRAFIERTGATGVYPLMYWTHNIHFIAYARAQQGRYEEAKQAAEEMVANVGDGDREMQMLEGFRLVSADGRPAVPPVGHDSRDARSPSGRARSATRSGATRGRWRSRGRAERATRRPSSAASSASARRCRPRAMYLINNKAGDLLALAAATLDAQVLAARGLPNAAVDAWRRAVTLEAALQYDEPPAWFYTVRQSLGAALLRGGDHEGRSGCSARRSRLGRATAGCCMACGRRCSRKGAATKPRSCSSNSRALGAVRRRS